jgi:hypothetical protein
MSAHLLSAYIHDGYTMPGYIRERSRLHPAVRFTYRPLLTQDRAVVVRKISLARDPRQEERLAAQAIFGQLLDWDVIKVADGSVQSVPLEVNELLKLQPKLFNQLLRIVLGDKACDEDPLLRDDPCIEENDSLLNGLCDATPAEQEELLEKN